MHLRVFAGAVALGLFTSFSVAFSQADGEKPNGMYDMLIHLVEKPLLEVVMTQADNNQSRAADWLGLNRNTLRKKLLEHDML